MSSVQSTIRGRRCCYGKSLRSLWYGYFGGGGALLTTFFFFLKSVERPSVAIPDPLVVVFRVGRSRQEQHWREWVRCAHPVESLTASSGREVAQRVDEEQGEGDVDRDEVHPGQGEIDSFDPVVGECERILSRGGGRDTAEGEREREQRKETETLASLPVEASVDRCG